ncbi:MAG: hypothetical protein L3J67_08025 [Hyphomicrobiaceae bacterium]|nr:hypothetical protein [Hyphomicrobiaceae bacterium]
MWGDLDRMLSDAIDPVMGEVLDYRPMVAGSIKGAVADPGRPAIPDLVGVLDFEGEVRGFKAGNGREAKFHSQVSVRRAELSVDKRQFKGAAPRAEDVLKRENGQVWQVMNVWLDGARYEMLLKRVT